MEQLIIVFLLQVRLICVWPNVFGIGAVAGIIGMNISRVCANLNSTNTPTLKNNQNQWQSQKKGDFRQILQLDE